MKRFLVVVDMQKDFVDGALGTAEAAGRQTKADTFPYLTASRERTAGSSIRRSLTR